MHHFIVCPYFSCKFKYNVEQILPHGYVRLSNRVLTRHIQILSSFYIFQTLNFPSGWKFFTNHMAKNSSFKNVQFF